MAIDRTPGSGGREKNVTGGGGGIGRRDDAIGSSGPVGKADGYSGRFGSSGGSGGGFGFRPSGGHDDDRDPSGQRGMLPSGGCLGMLLSGGLGGVTKSKFGKIIVFALIILILFYLISSCTGGGSGMMTDCIQMAPSTSFAGVAGTNSSEHSADLTVSNAARTRYCNTDSAQKVTVMIYMCATDLESKYGMATKDISEMLNAKVGNNINVILETGGTTKWQNSNMKAGTNQLWQITGEGLKPLGDIGKQTMTNPGNLTAFVNYCADKFPADRNILIFWDHGGGSVTGYGYDETAKTAGSMSLDKLDSALAATNVKFDFIGFDACLMATLENALVMEDYADYLIASEETEPGCGWYYTNWLKSISDKPNIGTVELGKQIIDDFVDVCYKNSPSDKTTLSIIDLAELDGTVGPTFTNFASSVGTAVDTDYKTVSDARSSTKEFSSGINQCDLINLCENLGTPEASNLVSVLKGCIKYNRTSSNIGGANGVSIYFPYGRSSDLNSLINTYNKIGMDSTYTNAVKSFANVTAGGQIASGGLGSQGASLFGGGSDSLSSILGLLGGAAAPAQTSNNDLVGTLLTSFLTSGSSSSILDVGQGSSWFDSGKVLSQQNYIQQNYLDPASVMHGVDTSSGSPLLRLTDEEWELVQDIELNVFYNDGTGYIDLGMDNTYEFDNDGNLKAGYDGTWLYFNDHPVSYYMESDDRNGKNYVITGRVPALLNGELVDIIVQFTNETPNGEIVGARINYNGEVNVEARGLIDIKDGDVIDFLCDYYTYAGAYTASYKLGAQMTVSGDIVISNKSVQGNCLYSYCLTDIYGNKLWTPSMNYTYAG